jgi:alpha-1,2-mannosyltransferase
VKGLSTLPLQNRNRVILSIAQFRPEKNHALQLESFACLIKTYQIQDVQLILFGSCRGAEDELRIVQLKSLAQELEIESNVQFVINGSVSLLREHLGTSLIGLHTMVNEHFGIGIVEYMVRFNISC